MSFPKRNCGKAIQTPWFSEIPEEWETKPIKAALTAVSRPVGDSWSDTTLLSLTQSGIIPRDIESGKGKFPTDFSSYQHVKPDDLIFCLFDIDETPRAVGLSKLDGMVTGAYSVFEPNKGNSPGYLSYFFHWIDDGKLLRPYYTGLRKVVRPQTFGAINIPLPPFSEQGQIANFLDRETAKIDALIAEQQRLIELLQEKRQAVISNAVTKGLNPNAPMKDSGVEWLGEVPEHWGVRRLRYIGTLQNGLNIGAEAFGEGDPFVSYGDVYNNPNIPSQPAGLVRSTPDDKRKYGLEKGDALFTRTSETVDDIGVASTCLEPVLHSTFAGFLIRLRPFQGVLEPRYSTHLFRNRGVKNHFAGTLNMVTRASLSQGELGDLPICIPPLEEQLEIAIYIEEMTEKSDHLISSARNLVSLLQERRSALISAAVTGQIDVRGLVPEAVGQ